MCPDGKTLCLNLEYYNHSKTCGGISNKILLFVTSKIQEWGGWIFVPLRFNMQGFVNKLADIKVWFVSV